MRFLTEHDGPAADDRSPLRMAWVGVFAPGVLMVLVLLVAGCTQTEAGGADTSAQLDAVPTLTGPASAPAVAGPSGLDNAWARDAVWNDGQVEDARYAATRLIYGAPRTFTARLFTNAEDYAPSTTTKANWRGGGSPLRVFKHHAREDVPTENYTYHFSTMAYVGIDGRTPVKVEMGSNEDCGATFKSAVVDGSSLRWFQSSYFPEEGVDGGRVELSAESPVVFHDALTLVLRGFPFEAPADLQLRVVPEATTTKWSPVQPIAATVRLSGKTTLELPIGTVEAYELEVAYEDGRQERYWFHADAAKQHVLVAADTLTQRLRLESLRRWAYWAS
ncbi:MAG: hypothetical protein AAGI68_06900 [Planctomycetota bacterium]